MLGRKDCTRDEFDHARTAVETQLAAYRKLVGAVAAQPTGIHAQAALGDFEGLIP